MASKLDKEIEFATESIESKTVRKGELAVFILPSVTAASVKS